MSFSISLRSFLRKPIFKRVWWNLVDTLDLGSSAARFGGSSPPTRTKLRIECKGEQSNFLSKEDSAILHEP